MRNFLYPLVCVLLFGLLFMVGGCSSENVVNEEPNAKQDNHAPLVNDEDSTKDVSVLDQPTGLPKTTVVSVGDTFAVSLESNPTTGYSWQAEFDPEFLELVSDEFTPESDLLGAGGVQTLKFKALKQGQTELKMSYKRPWEDESLEQKSGTVKIVAKG